MKIKGAFNEDLAPVLCYTFLNFEFLQSMSYGLSLEKKNLRSYLFWIIFYGNFKSCMKFHFLAIFHEIQNFAPDAENLHPDHDTLGDKKTI